MPSARRSTSAFDCPHHREVVGGDQQGGVEPPVEFAEQPHQAVSHFIIDAAGRFIRDDQVGLHHHGAGDGDALFFAARQRRRFCVHPVAEADPAQKLHHIVAVTPLMIARHPERQGGVLVGGEMIEQAELLEHHADAPAQAGESRAASADPYRLQTGIFCPRWGVTPGRPASAESTSQPRMGRSERSSTQAPNSWKRLKVHQFLARRTG